MLWHMSACPESSPLVLTNPDADQTSLPHTAFSTAPPSLPATAAGSTPGFARRTSLETPARDSNAAAAAPSPPPAQTAHPDAPARPAPPRSPASASPPRSALPSDRCATPACLQKIRSAPPSQFASGSPSASQSPPPAAPIISPAPL